ncbi:A-kinase anchoring protein 7 isoform X2 [Tiliqua scincoides]|uniref:A-kinase anchoring protein 7 isoform X2 n=1 Tax=Tiliqua scincoides TaxID=71010 RepID=UPI003461F577
MLPGLRWLFRTARFLAAGAGRGLRVPLGPRGFRQGMAVQERSPCQAEPEELSGEATGGGEDSPPGGSPSWPQLSDGCQMVGRKEKLRKEPHCPDDSINCLMMEMPFARADSESEFSSSSTPKPKVKEKRKRTTGREIEEETVIKKKKKNQPNYFISIPVTNPKITGGVQALQDTIIQKDHRLSNAMIRYGSFHVTLLVMHLSSEGAIDKAVGAFLESKDLIEELLQGKPLDLTFQGTDHFRNQVGFVKLTESNHTATLLKIADIVKKVFQENGIFTGDDRAFKPHMTFMKLSKSPKLRKQGVKRIDPTLFEDFKSHYFGDETLNRLDLCSMLKKKQPNGYYHCESSIRIRNSHESDIIKEALHRARLALLSTLKQIKELLSSQEIRMKMYKELLEQRQHLGNPH